MPLPNLPQAGNQTVLSGNYAELVFQINGATYTLGVGKQWALTISPNFTPEGGIGTNLPVAFVPGLASVQLTLSTLALAQPTLGDLGIIPTQSLQFINQIPFFTALCYDQIFSRFQNAPLKQVINCVFDTETITVSANAATLLNVTIFGQDAAGPM
jgi:hypothetical protein